MVHHLISRCVSWNELYTAIEVLSGNESGHVIMKVSEVTWIPTSTMSIITLIKEKFTFAGIKWTLTHAEEAWEGHSGLEDHCMNIKMSPCMYRSMGGLIHMLQGGRPLHMYKNWPQKMPRHSPCIWTHTKMNSCNKFIPSAKQKKLKTKMMLYIIA